MLHHGLGGVVHGGQGVHIFRVPAAVLVLALDADLIRRPVIDAGDVFVVVRLLNVPPHRVEQGGVGLAEVFHPSGHKAAQAGLPLAPLHGLEHQPDAHQQGSGQQHEDHRRAEGFKQGADVDLRIPGADHRQRPGEDEAQHEQHPPVLAEHPG